MAATLVVCTLPGGTAYSIALESGVVAVTLWDRPCTPYHISCPNFPDRTTLRVFTKRIECCMSYASGCRICATLNSPREVLTLESSKRKRGQTLILTK
ncbi:hypothetical protein MPTK1_7g14870 [Marchantia polymorpha subsp. ruderalis]|uniref:Uncharacterized protein n=2 Tax=Marchantia polymorpha TaxID=3197 RepID=A0AAF6BZP7_MARPO|nr:hypothetical protein MARPO_0009s0172 [Marchantia polymorpha]BBN17481.1 hypothetical protein Mp_7g14870 [Marchantia polymorpha subsp. ruderalis]|eukprot:PTQ47087.1 hypothetical protein MARPO_0009s0172 [Marchantia polymorpha]